MRPTQRFETLYESATHRLQKLRSLSDAASRKPSSQFLEVNREISFTTIELHTLAANFARAYFLSCVLKPITKTGKHVYCSPIITNFNDAINAVMKRFKYKIWEKGKWQRQDEPAWHQPEILIDCCDEIGCTNNENVKAAFSIPTTPVFAHLTKFRNFYAHRNKDSIVQPKTIAIYYSITGIDHPSRILCQPAYGRPQPLVVDWIDDISNVIDFLCQ